MDQWHLLCLRLREAGNTHSQLAATYEKFARSIVDTNISAEFQIQGVETSFDPKSNHLTVTFAGRTLLFVFESVFEKDAQRPGKVSCYLKQSFPLSENVLVGDFVFSIGGRTSLIDPDENSPIAFGDRLGPQLILFQYIDKSLSLN